MDNGKILTGILTEERMKPFLKYLEMEDITDVAWNGSDLWIENIYGEKIRIEPTEHQITADYIDKITQHIANSVSKKFNKEFQELEAETEEYRITAVHESAAMSGRCVCIRKTTREPRLKYDELWKNGYCSAEIINLIINCWHAGFNIVIGGAPGVGKTEFAKYLSLFIPNEERVITIEDSAEWHYRELKRFADGIEMKITPNFDYTAAIKSSLRLNPKRLMLSEVRSVEVKSLIESWSTGIKGITTMHLDDVRKTPDRILNMMPTRLDAERLENSVYDNLDLSILINKKKKDGSYKQQRYIEQVCFFYRDNNVNKTEMIVSDGKFLNVQIPECKMRKLARKGITEPFAIRDSLKRMEADCL